MLGETSESGLLAADGDEDDESFTLLVCAFSAMTGWERVGGSWLLAVQCQCSDGLEWRPTGVISRRYAWRAGNRSSRTTRLVDRRGKSELRASPPRAGMVAQVGRFGVRCDDQGSRVCAGLRVDRWGFETSGVIDG